MTAREEDPSLDAYAEGVRGGDRPLLARAITLIESQRSSEEPRAQELLSRLLPHTGSAYRVGISGAPGVGKSTLIDSLGMHLIEEGHRVAVLAVDPSSSVSGGSILGDKSRMGRLASEERAYIRPSPTSSTLGGVARRTRETMLLCEAAGYDVVIVETVGVGQSETMVAQMVDFFLVLVLAGAGDELQGIKKGILELADLIAVNKADGDNLAAARAARAEYRAALRYLPRKGSPRDPDVVTVSGITGAGLAELWERVEAHRRALEESGELAAGRREQLRSWLWSLVEERLLAALRRHPAVRAAREACEAAVLEGAKTPSQAADELLEAFGVSRSDP